MSVSPSPLGGFATQFFDNNGIILSGGKIYTYAAGTTTPQTTYTSASGATAHTNPIILDSAGRVPGGEIWLTDGAEYKFVIETSTGSLIGTYDDITGINAVLAELASTAVGEGASLVGIHDAGNYYTSTTVEGALQELGSTLPIADILALRAETWPSGRPTQAQITSNWTTGDGGGVFRWDASSTATDNSGTIIKETAVTTGRWIRQWVGPVFVSWFGSGSAAFASALGVAIPLGVAVDGQNASITFGTTGVRQAILNGQRVILQNLRLDITAVTAIMSLATGWSSKIGLGLVAESSAGVDMWAVTYPKTTLTVAPVRGDVSLSVAELSSFSIGDEILIHDTTKVWDADGTICSEGATVIAKSAASGAGTLTLGGSLRSSYTTSATVRRWVAVDVEFDNVEVTGAGAGGDQDGIWVWGARSTEIRDCFADSTENRGFVVCNGRMCDVENLRGTRIARDGLGYTLAVSGTDRVTVSGMSVSNGRHAFTSGRAPGGSQMQDFISITNVVGDGMQDCLINAHPGVYSMTVSNLQTRGAKNAGTNGDALIIFQGTHLSVSNARSTLARRHGVVVESFGHLDEARGHTYKFSNVGTEAGVVDIAQYAFTFSDAACVAANGFTGAANSPVDSIEFSGCDFVSRSGCLITNSVSLIREVRLAGGAYRSVGPTNNGHGFQTIVSGTGNILRVSGGMCVFESNGGAGFAGAFLSGQASALLPAHLTAAASRGANQWGFRIDQGTLVYAPVDATGFTTSATVAGTGGTLAPY